MTDFDVEAFDSLLRESLHEAAQRDLSADRLAAVLRAHADAIERDGLDAHVGVTPIPVTQARDDREYASDFPL